jgi:hypothetical protein
MMTCIYGKHNLSSTGGRVKKRKYFNIAGNSSSRLWFTLWRIVGIARVFALYSALPAMTLDQGEVITILADDFG